MSPERESSATEGGLSPGIAALVRLSAAIAVGDAEHLDERLGEAQSSAEAGAVEEALLQSYLFVGFPAALNALARWRERVPERASAIEGVAGAPWRERGEAVCRVVYGRAYEGLRANVAALHPDLEDWMLMEGYGKVLGRDGLPLAVRELCIVALLAVQRAPRQLHSHLRGALSAGAGPVDVEAALELALTEGGDAVPPSWREEARDVWRRVRRRHPMSQAADAPASEGR